jgi:AraC-like DNA-binding protein
VVALELGPPDCALQKVRSVLQTTGLPSGYPARAAVKDVFARFLIHTMPTERTLLHDICAVDPNSAQFETVLLAVSLPPVRFGDDRVDRTRGFIEIHFRQPKLSIKDAAPQVGLSSWRLSHIVKACTGRTFGQLVAERRIGEAKLLLEMSMLTVKEIAAAVGFGSTGALDRTFRRATGEPLRAYRLRVRHRSRQV